MIVREVAAFAKSETVAGAVFVFAVCGRLAATASMVAVKTHILRVVKLVFVITICN